MPADTPRFGTHFWATRMRQPERYFETPMDLAEAAAQYLEHVEENPLKENVVFHNKGSVVRTTVDKMRAVTWEGIASFLGMSSSALYAYRQREEFAPVIEKLETIIYARDYEGAAAGLLNSAIVSRKLNLAERNEITGANGGPIQTEETGTAALDFANRIAALAARQSEADSE